MDSWNSYPSIYNLGHKAVKDLFTAPVLVEEKVDGSQFSFGVFIVDGQPVIKCRSKGAEIDVYDPAKLFGPAVEVVKELAPILTPGWTYRAEYLRKPKHNVLVYDRIPAKHLILFDIATGNEDYLPRFMKEREAARLGLEIVPVFGLGMTYKVADLHSLLDTVSILGGQKIEGIVLKSPTLYGPDKKPLIGKYVSPAFKEIHKGEWREQNPTSGDIVNDLIKKLKTPARWNKAIQHLREDGVLEDDPRDIGRLMKEVPTDILKEEEHYIKQRLFDYAWPKIKRGVTGGLPEYYKQILVTKQFEV